MKFQLVSHETQFLYAIINSSFLYKSDTFKLGTLSKLVSPTNKHNLFYYVD